MINFVESKRTREKAISRHDLIEFDLYIQRGWASIGLAILNLIGFHWFKTGHIKMQLIIEYDNANSSSRSRATIIRLIPFSFM